MTAKAEVLQAYKNDAMEKDTKLLDGMEKGPFRDAVQKECDAIKQAKAEEVLKMVAGITYGIERGKSESKAQ